MKHVALIEKKCVVTFQNVLCCMHVRALVSMLHARACACAHVACTCVRLCPCYMHVRALVSMLHERTIIHSNVFEFNGHMFIKYTHNNVDKFIMANIT